jgi:XTP/dITP diphosphohydrolase
MAESEGLWSVDDVSAGLVDKLIRRNPHVFGDAVVADLDEITANWEQIKKDEKVRGSALDGIALSQPALALAAKVIGRLRRAGLAVPFPPDEELGAALLDLVADATARGLDPESALRSATLAYMERARAVERNG